MAYLQGQGNTVSPRISPVSGTCRMFGMTEGFATQTKHGARTQSAFGGEAKLTSQRAAKLDFLLGQAKCYSNFLREQIADIENQFPTSNGKRKAPAAQNGRAKRRKGAAQPAEDNPDRVSHPSFYVHHTPVVSFLQKDATDARVAGAGQDDAVDCLKQA